MGNSRSFARRLQRNRAATYSRRKRRWHKTPGGVSGLPRLDHRPRVPVVWPPTSQEDQAAIARGRSQRWVTQPPPVRGVSLAALRRAWEELWR